ncbi:MAG: S8 family serine peptidase [Fischerella sp.]|jgi:hypothetical protein|uniref:S8 family peptidase n=1 Tax=Fischerella sp. TaxID=1191 RepID=UPI001798991A|nr:S8 family serine peptidase [Fischerella sp.]NWF60349.1 S8 family serine peptidase [Fischerella sp.]
MNPTDKLSTFTPSQDVGLVESQGAIAINADKARELFGVDGTGVTIGVISDSFNNLGGAEADVASGDLPSGIKVLEDAPGVGEDEGRAIMQLIHDVAPGANFVFHTSGPGQPEEFADAIFKLADAGADIIVSDVGIIHEPMFQDGIIAQAIDEISSRPGDSAVSFFASAGNEGRRSYESSFNPSGVIEPTSGGEFHDFEPGSGVDTFQSITIPSGAGIDISFQWDSPFASVSGGAGSLNDLDIFLYDSSGTKVLASSTESNIGNDPVEVLTFNNEGQTSEFNLAISKKGGYDPDLMKYIVFGGGKNFKINEFDTASGTIFGNPNAEGAAAVGAISYLETPAFGTDPGELRFFSSAGGTPVLFDQDGDRLFIPDYWRSKPAFVAPDGVNTTFFGDDIPEDSDNYPNFAGTSASVAYPAGVAALMLDANPNLSPDEIYSIQEATALDMDDPSTPEFDIGFDYASGYGLIQADRALGLVTTPFPCHNSALDTLAFANPGASFGLS